MLLTVPLALMIPDRARERVLARQASIELARSPEDRRRGAALAGCGRRGSAVPQRRIDETS